MTMLQNMMREQYYCGLDLGAQGIKAALIREHQDDQPELLGVYSVKTEGFQDDSISDMGELSESIHAAISGLSDKTRVKIKEVQVGVGGDLLEQRATSAVIPLVDRGTKIIGHRDVKKVQKQAKLLGVQIDESVLHDFPQFYKVDDVNIAVNPLGLYGRKLEIRSLLMTLHNTIMKNLVKTVNQAGYDVADVFFSSLGASFVSLNSFQKRQGCVLIDIGHSVTNFLVYKDNFLRCLWTQKWGGDKISRALAQQLCIPLGLAEDIKTSYANVLKEGRDQQEEILIKRDEGYLPVQKKQMAAAMEPEIARFLGIVRKGLQQSGFLDQLRSDIFLCGGGALLPGLPERLEQELRLPVKLAVTRFSSRRLSSAARFLPAVGLAEGGRLKLRGDAVLRDHCGHRMSRIWNRVKDLYQEYF